MIATTLSIETAKLIRAMYENYFDAKELQMRFSSGDSRSTYYEGKAAGIYNSITDIIAVMNLDRDEVANIKGLVAEARNA